MKASVKIVAFATLVSAIVGPAVSVQAQGVLCLPPKEPFPYKLEQSDPLYETARDSHQDYLEAMETYINCIDRERSTSLTIMRDSFDLFVKNFGEDGVFRIKQKRLGDGDAIVGGDEQIPRVEEQSGMELLSADQQLAIGEAAPGRVETSPEPQVETTTRDIDPNRRVREIN